LIQHPSLTFRALEALHAMPIDVYYAVLSEKKYPRREPWVYRAPYSRMANDLSTTAEEYHRVLRMLSPTRRVMQ